MAILDSIGSLFAAKSKQLYWSRMGDDHVEKGYKANAIEPKQAYVVVRAREMSLGYARKLWRKFYPVLHAFVKHGAREEQGLVGPGQLKDISESNLDRVINLNQRLAGPLVYDGDDLSLTVGLYSVPGGDAAKALVETVGTIAGLAGATLGQVPALANAVKAGVESIFKLNECQLQLGVRDTFATGKPLNTGVWVGIAAERQNVWPLQLWLYEGRLVSGEDPIAGDPYQAADYLVLEIERLSERADWPSLPGIAEFDGKFADIMRATGVSADDRRKQVADLWPAFTQAVQASAHLTVPDKERVTTKVSSDLLHRIELLRSNNPFETRGVGKNRHSVNPNSFDFLDLEEVSHPRAAAKNPFAQL